MMKNGHLIIDAFAKIQSTTNHDRDKVLIGMINDHNEDVFYSSYSANAAAIVSNTDYKGKTQVIFTDKPMINVLTLYPGAGKCICASKGLTAYDIKGMIAQGFVSERSELIIIIDSKPLSGTYHTTTKGGRLLPVTYVDMNTDLNTIVVGYNSNDEGDD